MILERLGTAIHGMNVMTEGYSPTARRIVDCFQKESLENDPFDLRARRCRTEIPGGSAIQWLWL